MPDYYEINIALAGKHLFATAPRSITSRETLIKVYQIIKLKFPASEDYQISIIKWEGRGHQFSDQEMLEMETLA